MSIFQSRKRAGKPVENTFKLGMNEFYFSKVNYLGDILGKLTFKME